MFAGARGVAPGAGGKVAPRPLRRARTTAQPFQPLALSAGNPARVALFASMAGSLGGGLIGTLGFVTCRLRVKSALYGFAMIVVAAGTTQAVGDASFRTKFRQLN